MRDGIGLVVRGGVLDVVGLERLDATIAVAIEVRAASAAHREAAPDLADRLWAGVHPSALGGLAAALERTLDHRGGILDSASPELGRVPAPARAAARRDAADLLRRLAGPPRRAPAGDLHDRAWRPARAGGQGEFALRGARHRPRHLGVRQHAVRRAARARRGQQPPARARGDGGRRGRADPGRDVRARASARGRAGGGDRRRSPSTTSRWPAARLSYEWHGCVVEDAPEPGLAGARHPLLDPRARGSDRPRSARDPRAGDQRAQHRRQDRGAQDPRDARRAVAVRPARAGADGATAGLRSDPRRYRR